MTTGQLGNLKCRINDITVEEVSTRRIPETHATTTTVHEHKSNFEAHLETFEIVDGSIATVVYGLDIKPFNQRVKKS